MRYPKFNLQFSYFILFFYCISCGKGEKQEAQEGNSGLLNWLFEHLFTIETLIFILLISSLIALFIFLFRITISLKSIRERLDTIKYDLAKRESKGFNQNMMLGLNESNFKNIFGILKQIEQTQESLQSSLDNLYKTKHSDTNSVRSFDSHSTEKNHFTFDNNQRSQIFFFSTPESNGFFKSSFKRDPSNQNYHYKITAEIGIPIAKIEFVSGDDDIFAIDQKEQRLLPVCNVLSENTGVGDRVIPEKTGTVRKTEDGWIIDEKMTVRIV